MTSMFFLFGQAPSTSIAPPEATGDAAIAVRHKKLVERLKKMGVCVSRHLVWGFNTDMILFSCMVSRLVQYYEFVQLFGKECTISTSKLAIYVSVNDWNGFPIRSNWMGSAFISSVFARNCWGLLYWMFCVVQQVDMPHDSHDARIGSRSSCHTWSRLP